MLLLWLNFCALALNCTGNFKQLTWPYYTTVTQNTIPHITSQTMDSGSIAAWNVQAGDTFQPGDVFCSIETDKATMDFEAQDEGVVAQVLVPAGPGDVPVGAPILITVQDVEHVAAFRDYQVAEAAVVAPVVATPAPASSTPPPPEPVTAASTQPVAKVVATTGGKVFASPLARRLAQEMGYDIAAIPGTGPNGRVLAADVKEYQPSAAASAAVAASATTTTTTTSSTVAPSSSSPLPPPPPISGLGNYTDYHLSSQAQQVAAQLVQSKRNVPHYYLTVDVVVDSLLQLRQSLNDAANDKSATNIGVYEFLIKAAAASMQTVPAVNASWMESVVRMYHQVDINIVTGSGDTLQQPVLRNVAAKGLRAIGQELQAAVDVDSPSSTVETGIGTFTVINLGMYGVRSCAPIIREPQACALSIGALENRIVPATSSSNSDSIYQQSVVFTATLSCDHRVVDGAVGAQWLAAFKAHVENPTTLLL